MWSSPNSRISDGIVRPSSSTHSSVSYNPAAESDWLSASWWVCMRIGPSVTVTAAWRKLKRDSPPAVSTAAVPYSATGSTARTTAP